MLRRIVCAGAPRDLGLDQGRACRRCVRSAVGQAEGADVATRLRQWLGRALTPPPAWSRELVRHFPHLVERMHGLARGADVSWASLFEALGRELRDPERAALDAGCVPPAQLRARFLTSAGGRDLVLRESRPDGGLRSLAIARPGLAPALAGVNEAGLAMLCVLPAASRARPPSAALLGDQCLERFERLGSALEWCERRPGRGPARLLFRDVTGAAGGVEMRDDERRRLDSPTAGDEASRTEPGLWVWLDPRDCSIQLGEKPDAPGASFRLEPVA